MPTAAGAEWKADTPHRDACDPNTATAVAALTSFVVFFVPKEGLEMAFTCCSRLAVVIFNIYLWSGKIRHLMEKKITSRKDPTLLE